MTYGDGQINLGEAADAIARADTGADAFAEAWWRPEILRLRGDIALACGDVGGESWLTDALADARSRNARVLELRCAVSLGRLFVRDGRRDEARRMVAQPYERFTEGFAERDLVDARRFLDGVSMSDVQ